MRIQEVRNRVHQHMLEWRAIDALIDSDKFDEAYHAATIEQRDRLIVILKSGQLEPVRRWVKERLAGPLHHQSYRQLREQGKRENVPRWSRLTRDELIDILEKKNVASV